MDILVNYEPGHAGPKIMRGFIKAFRNLGHNVTDLGAKEPLGDNYDLIMGYSGTGVIQLSGELIGFNLAHVMNAWLVQYWADDLIESEPLVNEGLIYQSDLGCSEKWLAAGIQNRYLPLATDETTFYPIKTEKTADIIITGFPSPPRIALIRELLSTDYRIALYGPWENGWQKHPECSKYYKGLLKTEKELNLAYNQAKICLDMSSPQNLNSANFTVFNAMNTNALLITNQKSALDDLFAEQKPPVYTTHCLDVVTKYLNNNTLRENLAKQQQKTIIEGHTFMTRAMQLLRDIRQTERLNIPGMH